jgi:hypothetical protein
MVRTLKVMLVALVVLVLAGSAYAFAAANVVQDSAGGYAEKTVSGYTMTGLKYNLNATDPTLVDTITFSISPTSGAVVAAIVKIQTSKVTEGDKDAWKDCTLAAGTAPAKLVTCTYTSPTLPLEDITELNVVASSTN